MKVVEPGFEIISDKDATEMYKDLEVIARTCYKSEDHIKEDGSSAFNLVRALVTSGHFAMLDHAHLSVRFVCDRGVSHELVRHRLAAFAQESTRYCNYSKDKFGNELTVIKPYFFEDSARYSIWEDAMKSAERAYFDLLKTGASPQEARTVLPNSLKTEIVVTADITEWRHIFEVRCASAAHPQMREIMLPLLKEMSNRYPLFFADICYRINAARFFDGPVYEAKKLLSSRTVPEDHRYG